MKPFKPMLAVACEDITKLNYPVMASLKIDGIRASIHNGVVMSRSMKPIPSKAVQEKFGKAEYEGYDGEIIYGPYLDKNVFTHSTRVCMSHDLPEGFSMSEIKFFVFDTIGEGSAIERNKKILTGWPDVTGVHKLTHAIIDNADSLDKFEADALSRGAEGVMVKSLTGTYKQGRSTLKEGYLLKVKRFTDSEAVVIGFDEKMHNANEATVGELGQTKRSSHLENMVPMNTLSSLHVRDLVTGVDFNIGTGFNDELRKEIWSNKGIWLNKVVKYKHFEVGSVDKPRFPVYLGERMLEDMSN